MKRWVVLGPDGRPNAFYTEDIHGSAIPSNAIELTEEEYVELITHSGTRKIVNGAIEECVPEEALPVVQDIYIERQRRLGSGFDFDFEDARGVHRIGTSAADMVGWDDVTKLATALVSLQDTVTTITILTDTGPVSVTGQEWMQVLLAAMNFRQPIWVKSFEIMQMDPIPPDYRDDSYWT